MPSFGRKPSPDIRDNQFLMRRLLVAAGDLRPVTKTWSIAPRSLDQGNTGTCVGHAWKNFLRCAPMQTETGPSPFDIYRAAVLLDSWVANDNEAILPDGDPLLDDGTSIRAGAEAMMQTTRLKSYVWAFSVQSVIEWALTKGPVVLGTNWYSSMMDVNAEGIAKITQQAHLYGGHAYLLRGINTKRALATCENSWGDEWGRKGAFFLPLSDLERLLHEDGEACAAIEQKLKKALAL